MGRLRPPAPGKEHRYGNQAQKREIANPFHIYILIVAQMSQRNAVSAIVGSGVI
jgi:hypothetical protein